MEGSTVEWTRRVLPDGTVIPGYTFNIVWGCHKVSAGCTHCYAQTLAQRYGYDLWGPNKERRTLSEQYWRQPLRWNAQAQQQGHRRSVFCSSMADVFEDHITVEQERQKLWELIEHTSWLNWLLLTKRPHHILMMAPWGPVLWPDNVWIGTSVENQRRADERIPPLLHVPAKVRFLSCEPLLGPLELMDWLPQLQWVICGGESGRQARPVEPRWVREVRGQCCFNFVPFFFKQWGGRTHAAGGRELDGRTWDQMPPEVPCSTT